MYYITGDTHGSFYRVEQFCEEYETTTEDVLIILGDAGINFSLNDRDTRLKRELAELPITLLCIHGNHEERPYMIDTYKEKEWNGGIIYWEEDYPNLLFAKDGEIYDLDGRKCIAIGGAYSIDKYYRLRVGAPWFDTEQPSEEIKDYVEAQLERVNWQVDCVFSHTVPLPYEPTWAFIPGINQDAVDKSTENWLAWIEENLSYENWYAGHYHVESQEGPIRIMFQDIDELG
ncbi:MAG: metallophosphoesterase [Lachnospiraceae bacterium]|nr:metallophosphoesterase [Lachnospiraceae bacterium]